MSVRLGAGDMTVGGAAVVVLGVLSGWRKPAGGMSAAAGAVCAGGLGYLQGVTP